MSKTPSVPGRKLPQVAWRRIVRELRTRTAPREPRAILVGSSVQKIAEQLRERQVPRFYGLLPEQASLIRKFYPEAYRLTIQQADEIREHRFDLLGVEVDAGSEIDWHTDFKSGYRWPVDHHTRLKLTSPDGGFDVKVPWELSRFHHALRLGQAYLFTQDEFYAQEAVNQITHWIDHNPYEFGVNWAGPMDVAIRVVNWIWAYYMVIESAMLTPDFLAKWLASLEQHGEYLLKHLEDGWPRTNHLIANLTGLAYLGIMFPEFGDASRWRSVGLGRLWDELENQVYPDGMDYEASIPYHRLVTEMGLSVAGLCLQNGIEIPDKVEARLGKMLNAIMAYTQPDGTAPVIGDADDGRLLPLSVYDNPEKAVNDHRPLLALGSMVLERQLGEWAGFVDPREKGWAIAAGDEWQAALWYFFSDAASRLTDTITYTTPRPEGISPDDWITIKPGVRVKARAMAKNPVLSGDAVGSSIFPNSGLTIMRRGDCHLTVDAGGVGQDGAGGHAHNDTLSITLSAYGRTFLIDPGSYLYTSNPVERNAFRSTASHNVLQIGEEEIIPLPDQLFSLPNAARVTVHRWHTKASYDLLDVEHDGYTRLSPGVIHRRVIWFNKNDKLWLLRDFVLPAAYGENSSPEGEIKATIWFHFAPLPLSVLPDNNAVATQESDGPNLMILPLKTTSLKAEVVDGWYSPRYGIKRKAPVAKFAGCVKLPSEQSFVLYPSQGQTDAEAALNAGKQALVKMAEVLGSE
ncbi:MAG: alginate lyase family protein [Anaerolineae bacterium]|nr:alginate lyase family protein [Anaerolineae bacterium]